MFPVFTEGLDSIMKVPMIAIEVKTPENMLSELRENAVYYIHSGSKVALIFHPAKRLVEVYRPGVDLDLLTSQADDILDLSDVIPGFSLAVKDIFAVGA